jgi:hypothetical protein
MAMSTSRYPEIADAIRTPERRYQAKRKRILVVEDDRLSLIVLRQLLTRRATKYYIVQRVGMGSTVLVMSNPI